MLLSFKHPPIARVDETTKQEAVLEKNAFFLVRLWLSTFGLVWLVIVFLVGGIGICLVELVREARQVKQWWHH